MDPTSTSAHTTVLATVGHSGRWTSPKSSGPLIADSVVVSLPNNSEITASDFIRSAGAVSLTTDGRWTVLKTYERRLDTEIQHPVSGYKISYRRVLDVQVQLLAAVLIGEIPEYIPMVTR